MMAYHVVVGAIEGRAGIRPLQRLWLSLRHAVDGHVPYLRYQRAGFDRARENASTGQIERWIADWLATDLNPAGQIGRVCGSVEALISGYNAYNRRACLAVQTTMRIGAPSIDRRLEFRRDMLGTSVDPEPCKIGTLAVFQRLADDTAKRQGKSMGEALRPAGVAKLLGVQSTATAQVAEAFEADPSLDMQALAARLGCGPRSLQRRLREEGGGAEEIKLACRLAKAQALLGASLTLTEVALEAGYSDAAHMSRAFKRASRMTPSEIRTVIRGRPIVAEGRASAMA